MLIELAFIVGVDQWSNQSNLATVTINVVNETPIARTESFEMHGGETLDVSWIVGVLANDSDKDGDELTPSLVQDVSSGMLTLVTASYAGSRL